MAIEVVVNRVAILYPSFRIKPVRMASSIPAAAISCGAVGAIRSPARCRGGKFGSLAGALLLATFVVIFMYYAPIANSLSKIYCRSASREVNGLCPGRSFLLFVLHILFQFDETQYFPSALRPLFRHLPIHRHISHRHLEATLTCPVRCAFVTQSSPRGKCTESVVYRLWRRLCSAYVTAANQVLPERRVRIMNSTNTEHERQLAVENFAAELTEAAYPIILRQRPQGS